MFKIKLEKNCVDPYGVVIVDVENLERVLGCKMGILPIIYLGLPLGAPFKSTQVWKRQYLSKGGHLLQ